MRDNKLHLSSQWSRVKPRYSGGARGQVSIYLLLPSRGHSFLLEILSPILSSQGTKSSFSPFPFSRACFAIVIEPSLEKCRPFSIYSHLFRIDRPNSRRAGIRARNWIRSVSNGEQE